MGLIMTVKKLPFSFFLRDDVVQLSRELLGKMLFTHIKNEPVTGGIIVETEAYAGTSDRASHAYGNRRTKRTEIMFHRGGVAYVYLCYGIHTLFNIITNVEGIPDAILIRAIEPIQAIDVMLKRREKKAFDRSLSAGPGSVSKALGIRLDHTGTSVVGDEIWIEEAKHFKPEDIEACARVGVHYAGRDAMMPWRFRVRGNA